MDNSGILKFLDKSACKSKTETIKELTKKFDLDKKKAEELYTAWKKEYMKCSIK